MEDYDSLAPTGFAPPREDTAPLPTAKSAVIYFDGAAKPNPGNGAIGAVVRGFTGSLWDEEEIVISERVRGRRVTSHEAEFQAMLRGMQVARDQLGARNLFVYGDDKLVIDGMNGVKSINKVKLRALYHEAVVLQGGFAYVEYVWVPRESNTHADALAARALNQASPV